MKIVKIKNKIVFHASILLSIMSPVVADISFSKILSQKELYIIRDIDIDKDGIKDKVATSKPLEGDKLYFFKKKNNNYEFVLESINFSVDGGNIIEDIFPSLYTEDSLVIKTFFPDRGTYIENYYISYHNNHWFLTHTIAESYHYTDQNTYICYQKQNIDLKLFSSDREKTFDKMLKIMPVDERKKSDCQTISDKESLVLDKFLKDTNISKEEILYRKQYRYEVLLNTIKLKKHTLVKYNNLAYYLQKAGSNKEAVYLLEKILKKYPNRTVAYYNLGDAYWALGDKKKARESYRTYIKQMKARGKQRRIPKVVKRRVESK